MYAAERPCKLRLGTGFQQRPHSLKRPQAHDRRTSAGKKTKDHLFPKTVIVSFALYCSEFFKSSANFLAPLTVRRLYLVKRNGLPILDNAV